MQFRVVFFFVLSTLVLCSAVNPLEEIRRGEFVREPAVGSELHVLDWNIDRGARLEQIAAGMASQKPDLAILQEVDFHARRSDFQDVAQVLAQRLNLNFVFAPEFQELGQSSAEQPAYHGNAILTSLPIRLTRMLRFESQSGFWKPHAYVPSWALFQRRLGGRLALITELEFEHRTLVVYNLHLESRSGGRIQYEQLQEVLKDAARYPADTPVVVAGDINTKYPHSIAEVAKLMRDSGYQSAFGDKHVRTHVIVGDLDWIFARGPVKLSDAKVHREMPGSDHWAVSARLAGER